MAYNNAIPAPGDLLSQSQDDILKNFQAINTFVNVNHEAFNSAAPHAQGKHKQIEMPVQAAAVATDPTQWSMYVKNNTLGIPAPALFLRPPVSAEHPAGAEIDMTTAGMANNGWCILPCGIKMLWATFALVGGANPAFLFNTVAGFPGFTNVFSAQVSEIANFSLNHPASVSNLVPASITIFTGNAGGTSAYILVIGN